MAERNRPSCEKMLGHHGTRRTYRFRSSGGEVGIVAAILVRDIDVVKQMKVKARQAPKMPDVSDRLQDLTEFSEGDDSTY